MRLPRTPYGKVEWGELLAERNCSGLTYSILASRPILDIAKQSYSDGIYRHSGASGVHVSGDSVTDAYPRSDRRYRIDGDALIYIDEAAGRQIEILGYPVVQIRKQTARPLTDANQAYDRLGAAYNSKEPNITWWR